MDRVEAEVAVRQLLMRTHDAWNARDVAAYVQCFTTDALFTNVLGECVYGRDAISQRFDAWQREVAAKALHYRVVRVTHPAPNVAIVVREATREEPEHQPDRYLLISSVAVRDIDGQWRFASLQAMVSSDALQQEADEPGWLERLRQRLGWGQASSPG